MTFSLLWAYAFIRRAPSGWQVTAELLSNFSVTNTHWRRKKYSLSGCHIQIPYGEEVQRGVWYTLSHSRWQFAVLTFACLMLEPQGQIAEAMHTVEEWVAGENRWQHAALINFERDVAERCIRQRETKTVVWGKRSSWRGHIHWILRQSESSQVCVSVYILKFVFLSASPPRMCAYFPRKTLPKRLALLLEGLVSNFTQSADGQVAANKPRSNFTKQNLKWHKPKAYSSAIGTRKKKKKRWIHGNVHSKMARGRCLNVPGAVLNLWGAVNKQTDSRAWKERV